MKILILEDEGLMLSELIEIFEDLNQVHEILPAYQISEAMDIFTIDKPDFLIVDLYVGPSGLTKEETDKSEQGKLAGWIWLNNYVFKKAPQYKNKVIVYSDYIKLLKKSTDSKQTKDIILMKKSDYEIEIVVEKFVEMTKSN